MVIKPAADWRTAFTELAWLLGSWAFSWLLLSQLLGYDYLWKPQLDIQMHNTYFMFQPLLFTTLLFLPSATVVTGVRVLVGAFRYFGRNAVLIGLATVWSLILLLAVAGWVLR
jgi:hypothetical protein